MNCIEWKSYSIVSPSDDSAFYTSWFEEKRFFRSAYVWLRENIPQTVDALFNNAFKMHLK